jgi:hypothetical protein
MISLENIKKKSKILINYQIILLFVIFLYLIFYNIKVEKEKELNSYKELSYSLKKTISQFFYNIEIRLDLATKYQGKYDTQEKTIISPQLEIDHSIPIEFYQIWQKFDNYKDDNNDFEHLDLRVNKLNFGVVHEVGRSEYEKYIPVTYPYLVNGSKEYLVLNLYSDILKSYINEFLSNNNIFHVILLDKNKNIIFSNNDSYISKNIFFKGKEKYSSDYNRDINILTFDKIYYGDLFLVTAYSPNYKSNIMFYLRFLPYLILIIIFYLILINASKNFFYNKRKSVTNIITLRKKIELLLYSIKSLTIISNLDNILYVHLVEKKIRLNYKSNEIDDDKINEKSFLTIIEIVVRHSVKFLNNNNQINIELDQEDKIPYLKIFFDYVLKEDTWLKSMLENDYKNLNYYLEKNNFILRTKSKNNTLSIIIILNTKTEEPEITQNKKNNIISFPLNENNNKFT